MKPSHTWTAVATGLLTFAASVPGAFGSEIRTSAGQVTSGGRSPAGVDVYGGEEANFITAALNRASNEYVVADRAGIALLPGTPYFGENMCLLVDPMTARCENVGELRVGLDRGNDRVVFDAKIAKVGAIGGRGNDVIRVEAGGVAESAFRGQFGDDRLLAARGEDRLNGGDDDDTLSGGPGADRLVGGDGRDEYRGGSGDDTVESADGRRDGLIRCGRGRDKAYVGPADRVGPDCEVVIVTGIRTPTACSSFRPKRPFLASGCASLQGTSA